ncbi:MAG: hybrid sensor histidine kinase/response regulator [Gammaproteobacteria bacterium]|nr:hybrid sensor histidine kinase/response regulator [Gammaproteobacteria bacterium]
MSNLTAIPEPLSPWRTARRYRRDDPTDRAVLNDLAARLQGLDLIDTPVWAFDTERCQCLWANPSGLAIWRASSVAELQHRDVASTQSEAIYALVNDYLRRVRRGEKIKAWVTLEVDGNTQRFSHSYHHLPLSDHREVLLIEVKAAPSSEEMLAFAADYTLTVGLYALDGQLLSSNPAHRKLGQYQSLQDLNALLPADASYMNWPQKIVEQSHLEFGLALNTGHGAARFRGELRHVLTHAGQPCVILTLDNVTEQRIKETELSLTDHRVRLERLLDSTEVATFVRDIEQHLITVDHRWWSMLGYEVDEFLLDEAAWTALLHPDDGPRLQTEIARVLGGERVSWSNEYRLRAKNDEFLWVLDRGVVTRRTLEGRPAELGGILLDIDLKKSVELALERSEMRQRALLGALPDLLCVNDLDGNIVDLHVAQPAEWGLPRTPLVGRNLNDLLTPEVARRLRPAQDQVLTTGRLLQGELNMSHPRLGDRQREFRMVPYGPHLTLTLLRDVTDRHVAEVQHQRALAQLQQSQKMDALGQLTSGIAHDFNNILASMLGYGGLALGSPAVVADEKASEYIKVIMAAGERGRALVQKMLTFSRQAKETPSTAIDPLLVLEEVFQMLKAIMPAHVELQLSLPPRSTGLLVDATELHQILVNLVVNSRDAMREPGRIVISLAPAVTAQRFCSSCHDQPTGQYLSLAVRDTGSGIPAAILTQIFDPFFTTKAAGAGTGIGLSVVNTLVHRHGGHILVESLPGQGTLVEILLPCDALADAPPPGAPERAGSAGHGQLMVVDDEPWIGNFLRDLLEDSGYRVDIFGDGPSALEALRGAPTRYQLVLTDWNMPQMTGLELATEIYRRYPKLPVLLCTGAGELPTPATLVQTGIRQVLPKPIPIQVLRTLLTELLA